jgi:ABC-type glycerol-3-phosphate transport system substrate-binding protein
MKTFRTMAVAAGILTLAGCGSTASHPGVSPAPDRPAAVTTTVTTQPLSTWLPAVTGVSRRISDDLTGLNTAITTDPDTLSSSPAVTRLTADARAGLAINPPAGQAGLDLAWRRVLNDYLLVSGDLSAGNTGQASTDLEKATSDTTVLQGDIAVV